ncbi:hypothetical protein NM208_g11926 [Fusarium decemcellulare]|uniref:Uncharacterized protein n=1 Tax=Fusarium decemcellulare TaxID=57161 RepID=A0ACC1RTB0_9HYPO|nr:hypothetical protein NM208_g11926 [Fusarium decemcellulare]
MCPTTKRSADKATKGPVPSPNDNDPVSPPPLSSKDPNARPPRRKASQRAFAKFTKKATQEEEEELDFQLAMTESPVPAPKPRASRRKAPNSTTTNPLLLAPPPNGKKSIKGIERGDEEDIPMDRLESDLLGQEDPDLDYVTQGDELWEEDDEPLDEPLEASDDEGDVEMTQACIDFDIGDDDPVIMVEEDWINDYNAQHPVPYDDPDRLRFRLHVTTIIERHHVPDQSQQILGKRDLEPIDFLGLPLVPQMFLHRLTYANNPVNVGTSNVVLETRVHENSVVKTTRPGIDLEPSVQTKLYIGSAIDKAWRIQPHSNARQRGKPRDYSTEGSTLWLYPASWSRP